MIVANRMIPSMKLKELGFSDNSDIHYQLSPETLVEQAVLEEDLGLGEPLVEKVLVFTAEPVARFGADTILEPEVDAAAASTSPPDPPTAAARRADRISASASIRSARRA